MIKNAIFALFCAFWANGDHQTLTPTEIVKRSVSYHDPNGLWQSFRFTLQFDESRSNGSNRKSVVVFDNARGYFKLNRNNEEIHGMAMDSCFVEKGDVDCARAETMRNYYLYLWGLPMKLLDPGTPISGEYEEVSYQGRPAYRINVRYDQDDWFFYFDKSNFRMLGYMFYKPADSEKGEYILLEDEVVVGELKIPQKRSWYLLPDSTFLGVDVLTSFQ